MRDPLCEFFTDQEQQHERRSQLQFLLCEDDYARTNSDQLFEEEERERTPIGGTPIVLNPKVDEDAKALCCPECGEEIAAETFKDGAIVEYRCGCDELQKFEVSGVQGER